MTRVGTRLIAALAVAILAAGFLAACGGSESTTSSSSTPAAANGQNSGENQAQQGSSNSSQDGSKAQEGGGASNQGSGSASTPLKVSGGGSAQFRNKGGDNSIQEYGEERGEAELEEAAEALHNFYVARAERDWSGACKYLGKSMVQQLEQLGGQSPQLKGKGCAVLLRTFTRPLPPAVARETTVVDAGSLRTEGEQSFLLYYGENEVAYAMPMKQEDGGWKVTLLSATPLG